MPTCNLSRPQHTGSSLATHKPIRVIRNVCTLTCTQARAHERVYAVVEQVNSTKSVGSDPEICTKTSMRLKCWQMQIT
eukprot:1970993-Amphidinium_carterae.3